MTGGITRIDIKKPYCETCSSISRIKARWTQLYCRDCKNYGRRFNQYLLVRCMHHILEHEERLLQLHKELTILMRMYHEAISLASGRANGDSPVKEAVTDHTA